MNTNPKTGSKRNPEESKGLDTVAERRRMVAALGPDVRDERVLSAMSELPRELFVPEALRGMAYLDRPLPIGFDQTISQPTMVALVLQAAALRGHEKVLEVGAGSGYQAALLGLLATEVWTIELVPELAARARGALELAGASNVTVLEGDGTVGYAAMAPYDVIVVAAAAPEIPPALVEQLAVGGRLLLPVGKHHRGQVLTRLTKHADGISEESLEHCSFVPLLSRESGWASERDD